MKIRQRRPTVFKSLKYYVNYIMGGFLRRLLASQLSSRPSYHDCDSEFPLHQHVLPASQQRADKRRCV